MMTASEEIEFDSILFCKKLDKLFVDGEFDGWDLDVEFYGTRVYKRYDVVSSLYEYRVVGNLRNVRPDVCFQVYTDIIYRKKWDSYVKELYKFEEGGEKAIYWEAKCPFPLSNRDYTYRCKTYELDENERHVYIVYAYSFDSELVPPKNGVTRVSDYKQVVVITADDIGGTILYMEYFENPGIKNPQWLVNWAAKNGIPDFLTVSEQACLGYERYLQSKN